MTMCPHNIKIIDNFLPEDFQNYSNELLTGSNFPWYFNAATIVDKNLVKHLLDSKTYDVPQFTHTFVREGQNTSGASNLFAPIVQFLVANEDLGSFEINRVKANLTWPSINCSTDHHCPAHVDITEDVKRPLKGFTAIYYVNDSDGDTIFFKDRTDLNVDLEEITRVTPKKGRLVLFDMNVVHAGQVPINTQSRVVLNMNFIREV
jgi:hypothetical protein